MDLNYEIYEYMKENCSLFGSFDNNTEIYIENVVFSDNIIYENENNIINTCNYGTTIKSCNYSLACIVVKIKSLKKSQFLFLFVKFYCDKIKVIDFWKTLDRENTQPIAININIIPNSNIYIVQCCYVDSNIDLIFFEINKKQNCIKNSFILQNDYNVYNSPLIDVFLTNLYIKEMKYFGTSVIVQSNCISILQWNFNLETLNFNILKIDHYFVNEVMGIKSILNLNNNNFIYFLEQGHGHGGIYKFSIQNMEKVCLRNVTSIKLN